MSTNPATAEFVHALREHDRERVNSSAADLLSRDTQLGAQWFDIAKVLASNQEINLALTAAQRGLEEAGASAQSRFRVADILAEVGRHSEAIQILTAGSNTPGSIQVDQFVGMCALELGDVERAREALERVVTRWAGAGAAWLSLSALPPDDDEVLLSRLRDAKSSMAVGNALARGQWHYALGNVLDRLDRTDEAFAQFSAGAELIRKIRPYDASADRKEADVMIAEHRKNAAAKLPSPSGANRPIFVTGLPRSGTTLIEHLLVRHEDVAGGDELPFAGLICREAARGPLNSDHANSLGALYLHFGDERFGHGQRFVDKSLEASRTLALLSAVLPEAPIIWLRRDPLNCAWSCFRTCFSEGVEWSWSLSDIAQHFEAEDRLYEYWRETLGERLLTVGYEDYVANSEAVAQQIFDHAGLDPAGVASSNDEKTRAVTTASALQVRRPIYESSTNAADRYRSHLQPFVDAYKSAS